MPPSAYADGLKLLARRELSEAQVRQRLARKGHEPADVDAAVARLREERAIDDERVAQAIARKETNVGRGRIRVTREIEQAGIASATARRAVDTAFSDLDPDAMLQEALAKRLRGRGTIADDRERARLFRFLVNQGFEPDRVIAALRSRSSG